MGGGGRGDPAAGGPGPRRLQQYGPLAHDPLIVRTDRGVPWRRGDQQVVQETPPFAGIASDQGQVLRCEQHRAQHAEDLPGPGQRGPVQPDPVRPAGIDFDLDQRVAPARRDRGPDDRALRALPDQGGVGGDPVTAQGRGVPDGLGQIGLSRTVRPAHVLELSGSAYGS